MNGIHLLEVHWMGTMRAFTFPGLWIASSSHLLDRYQLLSCISCIISVLETAQHRDRQDPESTPDRAMKIWGSGSAPPKSRQFQGWTQHVHMWLYPQTHYKHTARYTDQHRVFYGIHLTQKTTTQTWTAWKAQPWPFSMADQIKIC